MPELTSGSRASSKARSLSRSRSRSNSSRPATSTAPQTTAHNPDEKESFNKDVEANDQASEITNDQSQEEIECREELKREGTLEEVRFGIRVQRDVDATMAELEKSRSARSARDPHLVTWDSPDDPANPKNWTMRRKWGATIIVSLFTFISPVSSSVVAPALATMAKDLKVSNDVELQMMLSIFVLAYAIGPLFLGPLSEVYGRIPVLQLANLFYLCWNLGCGFAQNKTQMFVFRFLSGLGGSAPLAIGGGLLSDCWRAEERGKAIAAYSLAPLLGPAIGPIAGGFITENSTWRWAFWATSIVCGAIQVAGLFFLQETYAPKLLKKKADKLRKETGNQKLHTEFESPDRSLAKIISRALVRPFRLLGTQPIVQVLALYMAYLYGLMYIVLSTFPVLWTERYHESIGTGSLNYIALGAGFFLGTQISAPLNDAIYRRFKRKNNNVGKPEFRVPLLVPGSFLIPAGLFWYGWSAQAHTHWIMPDIGAFLLCAGMIVCFQGLQTYIVDSYTRYAASAVSAATVLRSLAGFGFPLFAPYMYNKLDYGWGNSLLAFIAIALGFPAPFLLWRYGELLRSKSRYAAG